ncbi:cytochrome b/b6 domain-containing protein [Thalassobaculum salexigens]|uniref:cytochrome b/b6 domain-containing protein n=1 Tax=Thalassobaculum salexigens TaxID=455360 RepID=UPI000414164A|nr:cytochrome b/b6 domain-containing protein [Thalassobaculum salexigens]
MAIRNSPERYGWAARGLHWLTALAVAAMFAIAWRMDALPVGLAKLQAYGWHKSLGLTILAVTVLRLLWRLANPQPPFLGDSAWQRRVSTGAHWLLYACLIAMPVLGWLMSAAANTPVNLFGLVVLPNPIAPDRDLAQLFERAHGTLAYGLLALVALHVAAALKHHFRDRDATLRRMLAGAFVLVLVGAGAVRAAPAEELAPWHADPTRSRIAFTFTQLGTPIEGVFRDYTVDILFDPEGPAGEVRVVIETASLDTGDDDRDAQARGTEFFAVDAFPEAVFEAREIHGWSEGYRAVGSLTLKGRSEPLTLPFTLRIDGETAHAEGSLVVSRHDFAIGTGEWATNMAVGDEVTISISVTATRAE